MNSIINVESIDEILVLKTQGYLNKDLGEEILEVAKENIVKGTAKIVINLELSNIVNSIGASIMIELIEELQEVDGRLAFCSLTPIVEKTFNIMGLTKYCETFESQESAIQGMS
ncbi:STAS domain-containing protein [Luminiphilus sp.]|jgi:anti-anti-sigma factor|nr:STAS domain-containing protein [Luminiphilus sp.]MDB2432711.1 STAS domain-containing protein [Luminiphilus sp.]